MNVRPVQPTSHHPARGSRPSLHWHSARLEADCRSVNLPSIDDASRRREDEFWPAFRRDQPTILGGLLDAIVGGFAYCPRSPSTISA